MYLLTLNKNGCMIKMIILDLNQRSLSQKSSALPLSYLIYYICIFKFILSLDFFVKYSQSCSDRFEDRDRLIDRSLFRDRKIRTLRTNKCVSRGDRTHLENCTMLDSYGKISKKSSKNLIFTPYVSIYKIVNCRKFHVSQTVISLDI